jgi:hypothetical protein
VRLFALATDCRGDFETMKARRHLARGPATSRMMSIFPVSFTMLLR